MTANPPVINATTISASILNGVSLRDGIRIRWWRWNDYDAVDHFPADRGWMFGRVFDEMIGVVIGPVGRYDFDIYDDTFFSVRRNDGDSSFSHD